MKKAVLITGASSGIGAATALEFANHGFFTYLMGRDKARLEEVAQQCRSGAAILSCDLRDEQALSKRMDEVRGAKIHRVEALVNNAGIYLNQNTEDSNDEVWQSQFEVNLLGPARITRALIPYFKEHGGGSIVNVSSTLGLRPVGVHTAYSALKAAMINWTQSLAIEGGPFQIRSNCVCPGIVDTPIHAFHNLPEDKKNQSLEKMKNLQPLRRIGTPKEVAQAIYFLSSEQSAWTTGTILSVDGGINLL